MQVPAARIFFPDKDKKEMLDEFKGVLDSGWLTLGNHGKEFEKSWSEYVGCKHAITVNSGTAAIEIPLRALGVKGSDVIIPSNTFIATASAVVHSGGNPVLCDVKGNLCMDPESLKEKITDKTKGVVYVHVAGFIADEINEVAKICKDEGLFLVEDAAHAHGASLDGKNAGTFGVAGAFSFYPTKVITSGEGGMISTDDDKINEMSRVIRDQGKAGFHTADFVEFGHNYRMSELHAIVGRHHFALLDDFIEERNKIAGWYNEGLKEVDGIEVLEIPDNCRCNYYKYIAFLPEGVDRTTIKKKLKEEYKASLSGEVYEKPLHLQGAFKDFGYKEGDFPVSEDVCARHICPPIYQNMTKEEVDYVVSSLKEVLK